MSIITIRPAPVVVPASVTRAQVMIVLYEEGLLEKVEALVSSHPYYPVRLWWENALNFERDNAYLAGIAADLGLSEEQVDALFITASTRV